MPGANLLQQRFDAITLRQGGQPGGGNRYVPVAGTDVLIARPGVDDVIRAATGHAEEIVEPAVGRVVARRLSEVPLAYRAGHVSRGFQDLGDRELVQRHATGLVAAYGIEFVAEALLVAAGHQAGARRRAHGIRHITVREADTGRCQSIDVGRPGDLASVDPRVAVAEIIRQDHDDVGSALLRGRGCEAKKKKEAAARRRMTRAATPMITVLQRRRAPGCAALRAPP